MDMNCTPAIKWGDQFGDTMDAETVQKFGRIQGVQGLLMGRISSISTTEKGDPVVRVTLQAFEVETGKQLWGNEAKGLVKVPTDPDPDAISLKMVPGGWVTVAAVGGGLVLLLLILKAVGKASRPR
jgi:hypothetical protein